MGQRWTGNRRRNRRYREASRRLRAGLRVAVYAVSGACRPPLLELGDELRAVVEQDHLGPVVAGDQVQPPIPIDVREANRDHDEVSVRPGQQGQDVELGRVGRRVATGDLDHLQRPVVVQRDEVTVEAAGIAVADVGIGLVGAGIAVGAAVTPALPEGRDDHRQEHPHKYAGEHHGEYAAWPQTAASWDRGRWRGTVSPDGCWASRRPLVVVRLVVGWLRRSHDCALISGGGPLLAGTGTRPDG